MIHEFLVYGEGVVAVAVVASLAAVKEKEEVVL